MYRVIQIGKWTQAREIADSVRAQRWVFRGQSDASWTLETKLHREAMKRHVELSVTLPYHERWMLLEFQRAAHHHAGQLPANEEYLDWLALMQHYGGPTRLLDFTHSFYTAAFFAMEDWPHNDMQHAAVYAVNQAVLFEHAKQKFGVLDMRLDSPEWLKLVNDIVARSVEGKSDPFVLAVEPHRLDVRLTA